MRRLLTSLDRVIDVGLVLVLIFTPLAFGAVEDWAKAVAQTVIMIVFTAWVLKLTWGPAPAAPRSKGRSILGGRVRLSGLELPALLFAAVVVFQLVPLPPSVVRTLSPRTAEIFAQSLPGYGVSDSPSFRDLPRWLQSDPEAEADGVPALPPDPELAAQALPPEVLDLSLPAWRPLSLTPAHTKRALQIFLAHFALFVVAYNHLGPRRRTRRYLLLLCGLAGFMSVLGILQYLTPGNDLYWWRSSGRNLSFGPFVNANHFAGWMEMVLPICAGLTATEWLRQRGRAIAGRGARLTARSQAGLLFLAFITLVGFAAFLISKSRGGFLALGAALGIALVVYLFTGRLKLRAVALVALILVAGLALAAWVDWDALSDKYATLGNIEHDTSFRSRLAFSEQTVRIALDFPVLGTGLGTFQTAYALYAPGTSQLVLRRAHNDYAQTAAECGLLGLLVLLWALIVPIRGALAGGLLREGSGHRWPVRGAAVGVLALLLHSMMDFNLQIYSNSLLFVFLLAFLLNDRYSDRRAGRRGRD